VISGNTENYKMDTIYGDPQCPFCHGVGFIRNDFPVGHPDFGKISICTCRAQELTENAQKKMHLQGNLEGYANKTFDTFNPEGYGNIPDNQRLSLKAAFKTSINYAKDLGGWLILEGENGTGKTHLAAAIANFVIARGIPTIFLTVPDLLDWLRNSYGSSEANFEARFEEIRNIPLLIMDDFGSQNVTGWAQEKIFQIIDYRYIHKLPLVITSNTSMDYLDERIRSRFLDRDFVTKVNITVNDYRDPTQKYSQPKLSSLHHYEKKTFGNFSLRENEKLPAEEKQSLEKAFRAAQQYADRPEGWLVFMGTFGTGKTHLAAAIGNYRASEGDRPMFVVVPDLLDHLRATFSPTSPVSYDKLFEGVKSTRLLILDDLVTQSATPWAKEKLYQILNHRYAAEMATVITTSSPLEDIDPRIRSRMMDENLCVVHKILVPPYRSSSPKARRSNR